MAPIQACLQVNISAEASKSGVAPEDLPALAEAVSTLPGLRLRGLMTLPAPSTDPATQHRPFARLRELLEALQARGLAVDTLSMGMSGDWEAAIAEGATWVRIGTAIFGARRPRDVAAPRAQPLD
jgi:pyridoxal phosphate enzyme (YggS family)